MSIRCEHKSRPSAIFQYLDANRHLHRRLNADDLDEDAFLTLDREFKAHYAHPLNLATKALFGLAGGAIEASLPDGYVKTVTERRIPGTNRIRCVIVMSAEFYNVAERRQIGRGEVVLTLEGRLRLRDQAHIQNRGIFDVVIDMPSKRMGLTVRERHFADLTIVEFDFDSIDISVQQTD